MLVERFALNPIGTNTYVIATENKDAFILDPCATDMTPVLTYVQTHQLSVVAVINTHCHFDHVMGNEVIREALGVPLWLHSVELPGLLEAPSMAEQWLGVRIETRAPDRFLQDGEVLDLGDPHDAVSLQVMLTPGHSPGGLCFYDAQAGVLFSGDTLFAGTVGRTDLKGSNSQDLVSSLRDKLWPLPDHTIVYPGHEDETTIGEERMVNPYFHF
ncbi:MAG: MBL fold metallo-hydrolase [Firmicutes bacterium]|nr:MBL fold metallo-hydrolase [Bacillota bacterium]